MMTPVPDLLLFRFHTNQYRKQRHYHSEIRFKIFQTCLVRNLESESVCRVLMLPAKKEPRLNAKKGAKEPSGAGAAGQGSVGKGADKAGADCLLGSSWFVSPFASPVCASPVFTSGGFTSTSGLSTCTFCLSFGLSTSTSASTCGLRSTFAPDPEDSTGGSYVCSSSSPSSSSSQASSSSATSEVA